MKPLASHSAQSHTRGSQGFAVLSYLVAIAVVLVATGLFATYAIAGTGRAQDLATVTACRAVADAEVAYHVEAGRFTDRIDDLVLGGYLRERPMDAHGGPIAVRVCGSRGFEVLAGGKAVVTRML